MRVTVPQIFTGRVQAIPGDGRPSGIFKQPVSGPVAIGVDGLAGDEQADRRVHGGPEKAVHHFPIENHRRLAVYFPELAERFVAGALGENLSSEGLDEETVCIGDVYAFGSCRLQVSQPRRPCWKIDARHGHEGLAAFVAEQGIAGWYYRVLVSGVAQPGDALELVARDAQPVTLRRLWTLMAELRPPLHELQQLADLPSLNRAWRERLQQRVDWLRKNA